MEVTLRQIEEDPRFKLPFDVIHTSNGKRTITDISFTKTRYDTTITFWANGANLFPKSCEFPKEPQYIPFTQDDWEQFADKWIKDNGLDCHFYKIKAIAKNSVSFTSNNGNNRMISYEKLLTEYTFVKTNKPCGKLQE